MDAIIYLSPDGGLKRASEAFNALESSFAYTLGWTNTIINSEAFNSLMFGDLYPLGLTGSWLILAMSCRPITPLRHLNQRWLIVIWTIVNNKVNKIWVKIPRLWFTKVSLKCSSAKSTPFGTGLHFIRRHYKRILMKQHQRGFIHNLILHFISLPLNSEGLSSPFLWELWRKLSVSLRHCIMLISSATHHRRQMLIVGILWQIFLWIWQ